MSRVFFTSKEHSRRDVQAISLKLQPNRNCSFRMRLYCVKALLSKLNINNVVCSIKILKVFFPKVKKTVSRLNLKFILFKKKKKYITNNYSCFTNLKYNFKSIFTVIYGTIKTLKSFPIKSLYAKAPLLKGSIVLSPKKKKKLYS